MKNFHQKIATRTIHKHIKNINRKRSTRLRKRRRSRRGYEDQAYI